MCRQVWADQKICGKFEVDDAIYHFFWNDDRYVGDSVWTYVNESRQSEDL